MGGLYILDGHRPVPVDMSKWGPWFENDEKRVVARTAVHAPWWRFWRRRDDADVSTVFLGIDHNFGQGPPLLFETMIFGGKHNQYQNRCSTWDEAVVMHAAAVALAEGRRKEAGTATRQDRRPLEEDPEEN